MGGNGDSRLLKILHIDPERNWGGGEAQVFGLLTYLSGKGHHNVLVAHPNGALFERCRQLNLKFRPFSMRNDLDLRAVPALRRLIHSRGLRHRPLSYQTRPRSVALAAARENSTQVRRHPQNGLSRTAGLV